MPESSMNIGIAGAGLLGRLLAWRLLRQGHRVSLFDRDTIDGEASAARVAAAMLAPASEAVNCEREVYDWGLQSLALWPGLLSELQADGGGEVAFQRRGSLLVAHARDRSLLQHFNQRLQARLPEQLEQVEFLDQRGLAEVEPELAATFDRATFLADEGCLDNWGLLDGLARVIERLGGTWFAGCTVIEAAPHSLRTSDGWHRFDRVIDTRGLGAQQQEPELRGVRGEILWVSAPEVSLSRPVRLMHPRYQFYIAPKPHRVYAIGATEIESESMTAVTVRSSLELLSALYSVHTGFAEASIIRSFANCRPAYSDNLPRIDVYDGLVRVNGLYRHGFLLAPVVINATLEQIGDGSDHTLVRDHRVAAGAAL